MTTLRARTQNRSGPVLLLILLSNLNPLLKPQEITFQSPSLYLLGFMWLFISFNLYGILKL